MWLQTCDLVYSSEAAGNTLTTTWLLFNWTQMYRFHVANLHISEPNGRKRAVDVVACNPADTCDNLASTISQYPHRQQQLATELLISTTTLPLPTYRSEASS